MEIEVKIYRDRKVIRISGDVDMYSSPVLRTELLSLVKKKETPLLVDFRDVAYIDSSGIATFVEGLKGLMAFGGSLKFFGIPPAIMEIFSFSKLDRVFEIYGDIDDTFHR